jgi:hypothetical protein
MWLIWGASGSELDRAIAEIIHDPVCLKDPGTIALLCEYATPEKLKSIEFQCILFVYGLIAMLDICRIECRHAVIRRLLKLFQATHAADFGRTSGSFVLMRQRILEKRFAGGTMAASARHEHARTRQARKQGRRCKQNSRQKQVKKRDKISSRDSSGKVTTSKRQVHKGAGSHRAFMSFCLRGQTFATKFARRQVLKEANDKYRLLQASGGDAFLEFTHIGTVWALNRFFVSTKWELQKSRV